MEQGWNRVEDVRVKKICFFYPIKKMKTLLFSNKKNHVSVIKLRKFHKTSLQRIFENIKLKHF